MCLCVDAVWVEYLIVLADLVLGCRYRSPLCNGGGGGETSLYTQLASMSDMRTLLKQVVEDGSDKWGVALVGGAGTGAKLPLLRQLGAKHLLLAEAQDRKSTRLNSSH